MRDVVIVGASGFAREIKWIIDRINAIEPIWNFLGYIDNDLADNEVIGNDNYLCNYPDELYVVVAIGDTGLRYKLVNLFRQNKMLKFPNLIDPNVVLSESTLIGSGNIICAGTVLTVDVELGDFCIINLNCTIGHEAVLENFVTLNPGSNISGKAHLSEKVNIGTGSQVLQGRYIGRKTIIGAGAVVVKDMPDHCTAVGIPARIIKNRGMK